MAKHENNTNSLIIIISLKCYLCSQAFANSDILIAATFSSRNSICLLTSFLKLELFVSFKVEYFIHISALFILSRARGYSFKAFKHRAFLSNNLYIRLFGQLLSNARVISRMQSSYSFIWKRTADRLAYPNASSS